MFNLKRPDDAVIELIKRSGDTNRSVALQAQRELAIALQEPLRDAILVGDIVSNWFTPIPMEPGASLEFPLDLLAPGEEDEHVAYTYPGNGRIAERQVEGDYVMVPTYMFASSIDWLLKYAREANWPIVQRAMQVLQASFVKKMNDDGWATLITAAADRNILIYDADASAGQFTKRLISLAKLAVRRNGGGNSSSVNRFKLTDVACSPENKEDMRNWNLDQIDEVTRREIYLADDGSDNLSRVFGVFLHDYDEFGQGQQYQNFWTNTLGAGMASGDLEILIGADRSRGVFINPIRQQVQIYDDPYLHRAGKAGFYGTGDHGYAVLDGRAVIAMSL